MSIAAYCDISISFIDDMNSMTFTDDLTKDEQKAIQLFTLKNPCWSISKFGLNYYADCSYFDTLIEWLTKQLNTLPISPDRYTVELEYTNYDEPSANGSIVSMKVEHGEISEFKTSTIEMEDAEPWVDLKIEPKFETNDALELELFEEKVKRLGVITDIEDFDCPKCHKGVLKEDPDKLKCNFMKPRTFEHIHTFECSHCDFTFTVSDTFCRTCAPEIKFI